MTGLVLNQVSKSFAGKKVVDKVSLKLDKPGVYGLLGTNGAGKTRFTDALADSLGPKAFRMSALEALYSRSADGRTPLEDLLAKLMHDEMINLIGYKLALADGKDARLRPTRLDSVISLWQAVFPGNRVLIDSGKILFSKGFDDDTYSAIRLSDGERAVLYYAGAVMYAPKKAVIFIDSPELFLHPTLTSSLWNRLEELRSDCTFCYTTCLLYTSDAADEL